MVIALVAAMHYKYAAVSYWGFSNVSYVHPIWTGLWHVDWVLVSQRPHKFSDVPFKTEELLNAWRKDKVHCVTALVDVRNHHHNCFTALFWDHPREPVPEENVWTLWCKGRLTEADTPTIRLFATPSGLSSAHLHHPPHFFTGRMPFLLPNQQCQSTEGSGLVYTV